ncbi:MAG: hypothetical protein COA79_03830 [Planctomycetota bacterium]|nr:MAG: hypothetical protein COA79_03830 [Planctomycetota bacterium]
MQKIKFKIASKYHHLEEELKRLHDIFDINQNEIYKGRNSLKEFEFDEKPFIIKSFKIPNLFKKIIYAILNRSKAQKSFEHAIELENAKVNTPTPVGYISYYVLGLLQKSYYVCEKVDYEFTFHDVIQDRVKGSTDLFLQFAEFTFNLHQKGFLHLDYTPGNIVIKRRGDVFEFNLVDLNRMTLGHVTWQMGAKCFGKIYLKPEDMQIVVDRYASLCSVSSDKIMVLVESTHQSYERFKKFKKVLRFWRKEGD